eukprot:scaffold69317_cov36-Phaeocystis_antarctica.AAC.1
MRYLVITPRAARYAAEGSNLRLADLLEPCLGLEPRSSRQGPQAGLPLTRVRLASAARFGALNPNPNPIPIPIPNPNPRLGRFGALNVSKVLTHYLGKYVRRPRWRCSRGGARYLVITPYRSPCSRPMTASSITDGSRRSRCAAAAVVVVAAAVVAVVVV